MKRTFATTTFAVALLGVSACKGGAADAVKLVPDAATGIGGIDVKALTSSQIYTDNKALREQGEAKEGLEAAKACNVPLENWKNVTFGFDPSGGDSKLVLIMNADGIGKKDNLECIKGKMKEAKGGDSDPFTIAEADGKVTIEIDGGEATGWALDDNTVVVAGKDWTAAVKDLIDGKGKSAVDGSLKDVVARADTGKTIWFAGKLPADMAQGPAAGAKDVAGSIDLSGGVAVAASVGFGSADEASNKASELQKQFDEMKGMATGMGVPQGVVDSVKIEAKDAAVNVAASISNEDAKKLQETVMSKM